MMATGRGNRGLSRAARLLPDGRMPVPQRRTISVLGALILGMTLTSALLLALEPGPVAPLSGVTLQSIDNTVAPGDKLFQTETPRPWKAIVIHDSGSLSGSSQTLNAVHERAGRGGLGYHFVINNGNGESDGLIEVGFRWQRQFPGAYLEGTGADEWNQNAIGICLIGDADRRAFTEPQLRELVWLVQQVQAKHGIPADQVYVEVGSKGEGANRLFPFAWFRGQLLTPRVR